MNNTAKIALAASIGVAIGMAIGYAMKQETAVEELKFDFDIPVQTAAETAKREPEITLEEPLKTPAQKKVVFIKKDDAFPLEYGSSGERVYRLQIYLMRQLGWVRKPTGTFDGTTLLRAKKCLKSTSISKNMYDELMLDKMVHDQHKKI